MRVACVMMQRNEANALGPWLRYHGYLFGLRNLCVIDHGSDDANVADTLAAYEHAGVSVIRLPAAADYRQKGDFVSRALHAMDAREPYDFLLPLDCDEFVAMRREDATFSCARDEILAYLQTFMGQKLILEVRENLLNIIGFPGRFWLAPYQKIVFAGGCCGMLDHGSHQEISGLDLPKQATRLLYVHFHHKPYAKQMRASREKLRPRVNVDDGEALAAYRGPGWHLIENLQRGEAAYAAMMRQGAGAHPFPALVALLGQLGIAPDFYER